MTDLDTRHISNCVVLPGLPSNGRSNSRARDLLWAKDVVTEMTINTIALTNKAGRATTRRRKIFF
jgi:hypothetical protein